MYRVFYIERQNFTDKKPYLSYKTGGISMKLMITGTVEEPLTSEDCDTLFDILMQVGVENIKIEECEDEE